jgi:polyisoprenoid-binding protein YceI
MSTRLKVIIVAVVVAICAAGAGVWWFLQDDAPAAVALDTAVESVTDEGSPTSGETEGTWTIDSTSGSFDYESATGTFAGFRIAEELASIGTTTAVGRTGDVTGTMTIAGSTVTEASFDVDLTTITTNESRRDDKVQSALDTTDHPAATFVLTSPIELGDDAASGDSVSVVASGELTIHGVTTAVEIPIEAQYVNGTVVVVGSLDITFSDYDVEVPDSQIVLSVDDHGTLEFQLLLTLG